MYYLKLPRALVALALLAAALPAGAEVTRVEVTRRVDVGASGYEKIAGLAYFALDPAIARNAVIADLDKAKRNADGKVELSADLYILRPRDASRSNGIALVEVSNRGRKGLLTGFNRGGSTDPATDADLGDGFLMKQGYTLVWIGWQFDVRREGGGLGISVPAARGVTTVVSAEITPSARDTEALVTDLVGYRPVDPAAADTTLTVRDGPHGPAAPVARERWSLEGHVLKMPGGLEPGRTYTLAFRTADPPIAGAGLAAFRDLASWIRYEPSALVSARHTIAYGSSQSGRFLRTFLYYGFNTDERGRKVFDGVMAHIAGAARLSLNERGGTPNALSMFTATRFPFADSRQRDPMTGRTDGLLDNERARENQTKIFYTNSAVEYWGGGRSAALVHTAPDGRSDLAVPANVRVYHLTGTQHGPGPFPPRVTGGQQQDNPVQYWWTMRALLVSMGQWVRHDTSPPQSRYPRLSDGTLVPAASVAFPALPGVQSPRTIPPAREGEDIRPLLVPEVDADGNERAGVRYPEVGVPVATYTGWNFRSAATGGASWLVNLMGSSVPFARTKAGRAAPEDPRPSLEERYPSRDRYLELARQQADALVRDGYLLAEDVSAVMTRMEDQWTLVAGP